jgi:hypothetical protein
MPGAGGGAEALRRAADFSRSLPDRPGHRRPHGLRRRPAAGRRGGFRGGHEPFCAGGNRPPLCGALLPHPGGGQTGGGCHAGRAGGPLRRPLPLQNYGGGQPGAAGLVCARALPG